MTNSNERDELEKALWHLFAQQMSHAYTCKDDEHNTQSSCVNFTESTSKEAIQLIDQYTESVAKKRENQARMDELEKIAHTPYIKLQKYYADRITELQKEANQ